ncbi:MAG: ELWxxDGT repeat protein [Planctomycetota bacterium]
MPRPLRFADLRVVGELLFFSANDGQRGAEVWVTDGTSAGTRLLVDVEPGPRSSLPGRLTAWGDVAIWTASGPGTTWTSDGTTAGTRELRPGGTAWSRAPIGLEPAGSRRLVLAAATAGSGTEPWISDGTPAGTVQLAELNPQYSSDPFHLTLSNGKIIFSADDGTHGRELWVLDPGASAQGVGATCPTLGTTLRLQSDDPVQGAVANVSIAGAAPSTAGALWLALPGRPVAAGPCLLHLDAASTAFVGAITPAAGRWNLPVPVPALPGLRGLRVAWQALLAPAAGPLGADLTNTVVWTLGE